ncbi:hypothetical protein WN944_011819 [Citrus x changshan-huyou]|uniref:Uncharacterized protein n=1 Tax=Citrus x changshan-huyou TaxID=2935761 RepID=A0AAP0QY93_9ROSI
MKKVKETSVGGDIAMEPTATKVKANDITYRHITCYSIPRAAICVLFPGDHFWNDVHEDSVLHSSENARAITGEQRIDKTVNSAHALVTEDFRGTFFFLIAEVEASQKPSFQLEVAKIPVRSGSGPYPGLGIIQPGYKVGSILDIT